MFTAEEYLVLCDWFGVEKLNTGARIDDILDQLSTPKKINWYRRTDAAVAQIVLERVQDRLPTAWTAAHGLTRKVSDRRAHRRVELWPRHLFTINWGDSAPGLSWPVEYSATYLPGFHRTVVTASADCADAFGACDLAIGSFGPELSLLEGSRQTVVSDWRWQLDQWDQQRWEYLFDGGLIGKAGARAWADEVWANDEDVECDEKPGSSGGRERILNGTKNYRSGAPSGRPDLQRRFDEILAALVRKPPAPKTDTPNDTAGPATPESAFGKVKDQPESEDKPVK